MKAAALRAALALALAAGTCAAGPEREAQLGVYRWDAPHGPGNVDAFSRWLGRPVALAEAFHATDTWENVDGAPWQLGAWSAWAKAGKARNLVLGIPLLPGRADGAGPDGIPGTGDDVSLAKCAAGHYDPRWRNLALELERHELPSAYLRLGWEMDGGWYAWRAPPGGGNERHFAACFRRVVAVMRAAAPRGEWKFVWNPTNAWWDPAYLERVWPGSEYVDVVGIDLYDQAWAPQTYPYPRGCDEACRQARQRNAWHHYSRHLYAVRDFARAKGRPMAIPEWGVALRADGHGGGDNPGFIERMHAFIADPANRVLFHVYFDVTAHDGDHQLSVADPATRFPRSAARFHALFGKP